MVFFHFTRGRTTVSISYVSIVTLSNFGEAVTTDIRTNAIYIWVSLAADTRICAYIEFKIILKATKARLDFIAYFISLGTANRIRTMLTHYKSFFAQASIG